MFRTLLLKEWREQRWKAAFGCVIVMGFTAVGLRSRLFPEDGILVISGLFGAFLLPILVAMGMFATEKMERSHHFLIALPASRWAFVASKTIVALFICLIPLLGLMLTFETMGTNLFPKRWLLYVSLLWMAIHVVIWTAALGIRKPTEAKVAMVGLAVIALWFFYMAFANHCLSQMGFKYFLTLVPLCVFYFLDVPGAHYSDSLPFLGGHIVYSIIVLYFLMKLMVLHLMNDRRDEA